jgi:signal transduction histidine kinase/ActR/RegA family two-component response regulator
MRDPAERKRNEANVQPQAHGVGTSPPELRSTPCSIDDIVTTDELAKRLSRSPAYAAESRALVNLARVMAESPREILHELVRSALELCGADSAGISVLETEGEKAVFRWQATAGAFSTFMGHTMPRDFSPCGVVLDRSATLLMDEPAKFYAYIDTVSPHIVEALLVPFYKHHQPVGTVWVLSHRPEKRFDSEDARLVTTLSQFASAAIQGLAGLDALKHANDALRREMADRQAAEADRQQSLLAERAARSEAERAVRVKDEFLASLSHELRTPLTAIMGWTYMLREKGLAPGEFASAIDTIDRNVQAQAQLIDDLLDMSRLTSGKVRLDLRHIDLHAVVAQSIESVKPAAQAKGVLLHGSLGSGDGPVFADAQRLHQVFSNLLNNAVKFTPKGGAVTVALLRTEERVSVKISDTGVGITPDFLPYVFEKFRQADASPSRRQGGLGLGLSIAKQLVDLHAGTIEASSEGQDRGATFTVSLRTTRDLAHGPEHDPVLEPFLTNRASVENLVVLLVDDDTDSTTATKRLLESKGAQAIVAASASEALRVLSNTRVDVLVSDLGMPGSDGFGLIRDVRSHGDEAKRRIPAIALTAYVRSEDRSRALRDGFDVHIAKPLELNELLGAISQLSSTVRPTSA